MSSTQSHARRPRCPSAGRRRSRGCASCATTRTRGSARRERRGDRARVPSRGAVVDDDDLVVARDVRPRPRRAWPDGRGDVLLLVEAREDDARATGAAAVAMSGAGGHGVSGRSGIRRRLAARPCIAPETPCGGFCWESLRGARRLTSMTHGRPDPAGGGRRRSARRHGRGARRRRPRRAGRADGHAALDAARRRRATSRAAGRGAGRGHRRRRDLPAHARRGRRRLRDDADRARQRGRGRAWRSRRAPTTT